MAVIPGARRLEALGAKRKQSSKWSAVVGAARRAPELLFVSTSSHRVFFLLVDGT